jgi:methylated-DNA-protein-cysteine methyltransferase-like protein
MREVNMSYSSAPNPKQYQAAVWEITRQVPPGKVTTYGQIAGMIPPPGSLNIKEYETFSARWVGGALANCPADVPWQRVINAQGKISFRPGAGLQRQLLENEGVEFDDRQRIDFDLYGWNGPDPEWCQAHGLFPLSPLVRPQMEMF